MGALHTGHGRLLERARRECDCVVVSIFVNPLQFDRPDDLRRYPRPLEGDLEFCTRMAADVVFAPAAEEMYPVDPMCTVDVGRLSDHLCGRYRPGHFRGVATVVLKLLEIVRPHSAYFGEKDAQQLAIIRRLVADLNVPVVIVGVPTVRESDGLAVSSRNEHLSREQRRVAVALYHALCEARDQIAAGIDNAEAVKKAASASVTLESPVRLEYLDIVDPDDMQPVERITSAVCVAGAIWVGTTRLIDNMICVPPK